MRSVVRVHLSPLFKYKAERLNLRRGGKAHLSPLFKYSTIWGYSSVGRAPALQAGGHEFESRYLHSVRKNCKNKMRTSRTKFSRSWHNMPMHEKALVLRQTSLSHTTVFHALASLCTLKTAYKKFMIRKISRHPR